MADNEEEKIYPPPPPSTPREAPWREVEEVISGLKTVTQKLDTLISLYTGVPPAPPIPAPPVPAPPAPLVTYACPYCGAEFSALDELLAHQAAQHPGLPPQVAYVCPHCGTQFESLEALNQHIATAHPAVPPIPAPPGVPYACPYCGAEFSTMNELLAHLAAQHPGQPVQVAYGCPYCGAQFDSLEALNQHIATAHPAVPPVAPPVPPVPPEQQPVTFRLDRLISTRTNRDTFATGERDVTTTGTPEQLDDFPVPDGFSVTVIARTGNTGYIYLGSTKADCANNKRRFDGLTAGLAVSLRIKNLSKVWVDASVSGEGVSWIVER